jgi:polyisoprenoid-binding protein YceI
MKLQTIFRNTALAALCIAVPALAALKTDPAKSSVTATFSQMKVPMDGKFKKFNAVIDFDKAKPEAAKASLDIEIPSFDLGDPQFNAEVLKKEWFNAKDFPKATFVSSAIKSAGGDKYTVTGKLTIKGKAADVSFPMSVKADGKNQVFEGSLPIKRLTYTIGEGEWKDTSMVADDVIIKFKLVAAP